MTFAVLIVDVQRRFLKLTDEGKREALLHGIERVIHHAVKQDIPIIATFMKGKGDLPRRLRRMLRHAKHYYPVVKKPVNSVFSRNAHAKIGRKDVDLKELLQKLGITKLCFMGLNKSVCVYWSVADIHHYYKLFSSQDLVVNTDKIAASFRDDYDSWYQQHCRAYTKSYDDLLHAIHFFKRDESVDEEAYQTAT